MKKKSARCLPENGRFVMSVLGDRMERDVLFKLQNNHVKVLFYVIGHERYRKQSADEDIYNWYGAATKIILS